MARNSETAKNASGDPALGEIRDRLDRIVTDLGEARQAAEDRFAAFEAQLKRLHDKLGLLNTQVWALRDDLPEMLAGAKGGAPRDTDGQ